MTEQTYKISNMTCSSCVIHIEDLEDKLPGVNKIAVNFRKHLMTAEYDESKISSQKIADAVTKLGYPATLTDNQPAKKCFLGWGRKGEK